MRPLPVAIRPKTKSKKAQQRAPVQKNKPLRNSTMLFTFCSQHKRGADVLCGNDSRASVSYIAEDDGFVGDVRRLFAFYLFLNSVIGLYAGPPERQCLTQSAPHADLALLSRWQNDMAGTISSRPVLVPVDPKAYHWPHTIRMRGLTLPCLRGRRLLVGSHLRSLTNPKVSEKPITSSSPQCRPLFLPKAKCLLRS